MGVFGNKKGLTLIELIVTLGLVGLVTAAAGLMYFSGVKGWERSENQVEVQQNLRAALNTLSDEIRKADSIAVYPDQKKISLTFKGGSVRSYRFNQEANEIRLDESSATVAMYIEDLSFDYDGDSLLEVSVTTRALPGIDSRNYIYRINTRGKNVDEH